MSGLLVSSAVALLLTGASPPPVAPDLTRIESTRNTHSTAEALVFVGRNGSRYHGEDCPRLRFATAVARSKAMASMAACNVCNGQLMGAEVGTIERAAAVSTQPVRSATFAPATLGHVLALPTIPVVSKPRGPDHGKYLGGLIGFGVGFGLGYLINEQDDTCLFGGSGCGPFFPSSKVGAITGVIGAGIGTVIGARMDAMREARFESAFERERQRMRARRAAREQAGRNRDPADRVVDHESGSEVAP